MILPFALSNYVGYSADSFPLFLRILGTTPQPNRLAIMATSPPCATLGCIAFFILNLTV